MKHIARKRFGQHFLTDAGIIDAIVATIAPAPGDAMVEIGPGLAALTQPLVERLGRLTVIELDRDLAARLREHPQLDVVESDVLKVDFAALAERMQNGNRVGAIDPGAGPPQAGISPLGGQRHAQRRRMGDSFHWCALMDARMPTTNNTQANSCVVAGQAPLQIKA